MSTIEKTVQQPTSDWRGRLHLGAYTTTEAAWLIETTRQMVVTWRRIAYLHEAAPAQTTSARPILLSYMQLVETAVAITLRGNGASFADIFSIYTRLREQSGNEYPFAASALRDIRLSTVRNAPRFAKSDSEIRWQRALQHRLDQFDYEDGCALRWYPRGRDGLVVVDPRIAFGAPTIAGTGVALHIIQERLVSDETPAMIAADFGLTPAQVDAVEGLLRPRAHRAA